MNIALVAQDSKKELMVRFCIAYVGILSRHKLCATATTGKLISNATGLRIVSFLSGEQGGCQQIAYFSAVLQVLVLIEMGTTF